MIVVKIGGAAGVDAERICANVAALWRDGRRMVLAHGGSDETNRLAEQLGTPARFVTSASGHTSRLTDRNTLEIFMMATAAVLVRFKLTNYFYPLAVAWALTAIAVKQSGQTSVVVASAFGVIACLIASLSFVMNLRSSITPEPPV